MSDPAAERELENKIRSVIDEYVSDPAAERELENKIRSVIDEYVPDLVEQGVKDTLKELFTRCAMLQTQMVGQPPEKIQAAVSGLLLEWIEEE